MDRVNTSLPHHNVVPSMASSHPFSRDIPINPASSALLIVDMQNFCCRNGLEKKSAYYLSTLPSVEERIAILQKICREKKIEVIYTVIENMTQDGRDRGLDYRISGFDVPRGSDGACVVSTLAPIEDEMIFSKTSCSCFMSTNIDFVLRSMGVKQLIVCGGLTDQCISSIVRDACDLGYLVSVPTDCCVAKSLDLHTTSLDAIKGYCRLCTSGTLESELSVAERSRPMPVSPSRLTLTHHTHRIMWVDSAGIIRCRAIAESMLSSCSMKGLGLTTASMAMLGHADALAGGAGLDVVGEVRLVPDGATHTLPWMPSHSLSFGALFCSPGQPWVHCPRHILRRVLQWARSTCDGLEVEIGFEIEVVLLHKGTLEPIDTSSYCSARAFDATSSLLDEIVDALHSLGLRIDQFHCESAHGQFEIVLHHQRAELMVDQLYLARLTITAVAERRGIDASFLPKSSASQAGNGQHLHMSLWRRGQNLFTANGAQIPVKGSTEYRPPREAGAFVAGVLHHLPGLMALTAPSPNSFRRVRPSCWSGAFQCWGVDNREAPIRVCSVPGGPPDNFEVKCFDATANAYLGVAGVVIAGVNGILSGMKLPDPVHQDPVELESSLRPPLLPITPSAAASHLREDTVMVKVLGECVTVCLAAVREAEEIALGEMKLEDEVQLMMLKY